jgi:hypothetical protein
LRTEILIAERLRNWPRSFLRALVELQGPSKPWRLTIYPNLAELYRRRVMDLEKLLVDPELGSEAMDLIRSMITANQSGATRGRRGRAPRVCRRPRPHSAPVQREQHAKHRSEWLRRRDWFEFGCGDLKPPILAAD